VKSALRVVLPFAVTTAILAWLFRSIGVRDVFAQLSLEATAKLVPVIVVYAVLSLWIEGLSLTRLTSHAGRHAGIGLCARIKAASYALGMVNYALGMAGLTVLFRRRVGLPMQVAAGLVATVSVFDLGMMMAIALIGAVLATSQGAVLRLGLVSAVIAAVGAGLFVLRAPFALGPLDRIRDLELFHTARSAPWSLLAELAGLRAAFALVFIGTGLGSLLAFDIRIPLADGVVGLSAVAVVGAAPIAVSGLGTVQAAVVYLFGEWAERDVLLAASLAMQAAMIAVRAAMALLFAGEFTREAAEAAREAAGAASGGEA